MDLSKASDSIHREKLLEIPSIYGVPKVIVDAINILYKNITLYYCARLFTSGSYQEYINRLYVREKARF